MPNWNFFDGVNVLLSHAGGFPVISIGELMRVIGHVAPRVVIPMHYRTPEYLRNDMFTIDEFLSVFPRELVDMTGKSTVTIDAGALPDTTRALVSGSLLTCRPLIDGWHRRRPVSGSGIKIRAPVMSNEPVHVVVTERARFRIRLAKCRSRP